MELVIVAMLVRAVPRKFAVTVDQPQEPGMEGVNEFPRIGRSCRRIDHFVSGRLVLRSVITHDYYDGLQSLHSR